MRRISFVPMIVIVFALAVSLAGSATAAPAPRLPKPNGR